MFHLAAELFNAEDTTLPEVIHTLAGVLPQYAFEDLDSNLQTFDMLLENLSPAVRPELSRLLSAAASETADARCRERIEQAA